jgi:SET domain-containing protein
MKQDTMVAEYRGTILRPTVANAREKHYRSIGKDCYLFTVNDEVVIDATKAGTFTRFTVSPRFSAVLGGHDALKHS